MKILRVILLVLVICIIGVIVYSKVPKIQEMLPIPKMEEEVPTEETLQSIIVQVDNLPEVVFDYVEPRKIYTQNEIQKHLVESAIKLDNRKRYALYYVAYKDTTPIEYGVVKNLENQFIIYKTNEEFTNAKLVFIVVGHNVVIQTNYLDSNKSLPYEIKYGSKQGEKIKWFTRAYGVKSLPFEKGYDFNMLDVEEKLDIAGSKIRKTKEFEFKIPAKFAQPWLLTVEKSLLEDVVEEIGVLEFTHENEFYNKATELLKRIDTEDYLEGKPMRVSGVIDEQGILVSVKYEYLDITEEYVLDITDRFSIEELATTPWWTTPEVRETIDDVDQTNLFGLLQFPRTKLDIPKYYKEATEK